MNNLPSEGLPTQEESHFTNYLLSGISTYVSQKPTDRSILIAAISQISKIVFCQQTPFGVKEQCKEIDDFCNYLKKYALRDAVRS